MARNIPWEMIDGITDLTALLRRGEKPLEKRREINRAKRGKRAEAAQGVRKSRRKTNST